MSKGPSSALRIPVSTGATARDCSHSFPSSFQSNSVTLQLHTTISSSTLSPRTHLLPSSCAPLTLPSRHLISSGPPDEPRTASTTSRTPTSEQASPTSPQPAPRSRILFPSSRCRWFDSHKLMATEEEQTKKPPAPASRTSTASSPIVNFLRILVTCEEARGR
eukprot:761871-Hanusia_phi.AAC.3